jgi:hypothetical protein
MNRRHMTGDHRGRTAGRAALLTRAMDEIFAAQADAPLRDRVPDARPRQGPGHGRQVGLALHRRAEPGEARLPGGGRHQPAGCPSGKDGVPDHRGRPAGDARLDRGRMVLVGDAVRAPSGSTGQGASLAIESSIQLARCLRDLPDATSAFRACERLRRERAERITKRGARTNSARTPGPAGRKAMHALMPIFFKVMNFEKVTGREQRYQIGWDAPATGGTPPGG